MINAFDDEAIPLAQADTVALNNAAVDLVLLDVTKVRLFYTGGSTVRATIIDPQIGAARTCLRVQIARAYPLSEPERFIGLRDDKDKDIGMLPALKDLDAESRRIVNDELDRRYFIPKILKVRSIDDQFGTITFEVTTDRGDRTFYLQNLKESTIELPPHRLIVSDRDGSRWEFPDVRNLDSKTATVLQRVIS